MAITINGNGTVTGISAGGLPDGCIQEADLATSVNTITQADQWRVNANFTTANAEGITSNWERNDNNFSLIGSGMSESSGIFTFPETGIWRIDWTAMGGKSGGQVRYIVAEILYTANNWSSSASLGYGNGSISNDDGAALAQTDASAIFDVTNTSTHKVKFTVYAEASLTWECSTTSNATYATFIRLGDT